MQQLTDMYHSNTTVKYQNSPCSMKQARDPTDLKFPYHQANSWVLSSVQPPNIKFQTNIPLPPMHMGYTDFLILLPDTNQLSIAGVLGKV